MIINIDLKNIKGILFLVGRFALLLLLASVGYTKQKSLVP